MGNKSIVRHGGGHFKFPNNSDNFNGSSSSPPSNSLDSDYLNSLLDTQKSNQLALMEAASKYRARESNQSHIQNRELMGDEFTYASSLSNQSFGQTLTLNNQKFEQTQKLSEQDYQQTRGLNEQNYDFTSALSEQDYQQARGLNEQGYRHNLALQDDSQAFTLQRDESQHQYIKERDAWQTEQEKNIRSHQSELNIKEADEDNKRFLHTQDTQRQAALNYFNR